ncbi:MAG TPA: alpha-ketoglutarate-dependent dioxygenase AlkB [Vicinamibacterales bacterium]|jgi:alkylated DNA repair dioxygenase AlkB
MTGSLFEPSLPLGFVYRDSFITRDEETSLVAHIAQVEFSTFEMHGVAARRRVAFFGRSYDASRIVVAPHLPSFLMPLRDRIAEWARLDPSAFVMALINEYPPGAPIGWHRDAPQYGIVGGVSLLSACRMKLRPYVSPGSRSTTPRRSATHEIELAPRSAYLMIGEARQKYEHHIPPVDTLRYSITFRTARERAA